MKMEILVEIWEEEIILGSTQTIIPIENVPVNIQEVTDACQRAVANAVETLEKHLKNLDKPDSK